MTRDVESDGTFGGEEASILTCIERFWQYVEQFPAVTLWLDELVKFLYHHGIVGLRGRVYGYHARGITNA